MSHPTTVIFWGAGATASLGMRMTDQQGQFIARLWGANTNPKPLNNRVQEALGDGIDPVWVNVLFDLITVLGDTEESKSSIHIITAEQLSAMRRHLAKDATEEDVRRRIMALRLRYDWPALKDVVEVCPGVRSAHFKINDLFNVLDMHIPLGHGFTSGEGRFLSAARLLGAKAALKMLLHAMFYIDYQTCIKEKLPTLKLYHQFATSLGRRMQSGGVALAADADRPEFIIGDVGFVSLNYDPIGLWTQFVANRELNKAASVPHVGSPAVPLQIFHDLGHFIPSRRIRPNKRPASWYPMNEASAQRLNEPGSGANQRVRLTKFLFPHGCLCWRECPNCGKLSAYHGDQWDLDSSTLIPPPPLRGFELHSRDLEFGQLHDADRKARQSEEEAWEDGRVDARACLHCNALTNTYDTQTVMQSSFKQTPPSFIEEIQRDLRALVMRADHIIFMGYSLPVDDVTYRAFFAVRRQRGVGQGVPVRCSIIGYNAKSPGWSGPTGLNRELFPAESPVHSALDIFGEDNVRFYGGGVPEVFTDSAGNVSTQRIEELLAWPAA